MLAVLLLLLAAAAAASAALHLWLRREALLGSKQFSLSGGKLGKTFDNSVRTILFWFAQRRADGEFYRLPPQPTAYYGRRRGRRPVVALKTSEETNKVGVPVLTESWLRNAMRLGAIPQLVEEKLARRQKDQQCSAAVTAGASYAAADEDKEKKNPWKELFGEGQFLPLLQPVVGNWYRPIDWWEDAPIVTHSNLPSVLPFDADAMDSFMYRRYFRNDDDEADTLWDIFQENLSLERRVELWGLCAVYEYGGTFVAPEIRSIQSLQGAATSSDLYGDDGESSCQQAFNKKKTSNPSTAVLTFRQERGRVLFVASNQPNNPRLRCLIALLQEHVSRGRSIVWGRFWGWVESTLAKFSDVSTCQLDKQTDHSANLFQAETGDREAFAAFEGEEDESSTRQTKRRHSPPPRWSVRVREAAGTPPAPRPSKTKRRWAERLSGDLGCRPSWWCHRCLRLPWFGSFASCRRICGCYAERLCSTQDRDHDEQPHEVAIQVEVEEMRNSTEERIPRIIHQTWFEELTTNNYPHLQRMQHSWKVMRGWDYRFYTDEMARAYVQQHFPRLFVDAYDAIAVPAFRADFFRLCVLAIDGGVYADIDVQLDVNLDAFVTRNLSFFVPRDANIDYYPNSNYCAWNGLMGASPGHPILFQALQTLVNRALNRQDYLDIERDLCRQDLSISIWKLRCSPMLLLTGPCALGISMSEALGRDNPTEGWDFGWQYTGRLGARHVPYRHDWGDVLLLLLDRYDMGELRFTDIGRNLLVASTNQDRVLTRPLYEQQQRQQQHEKPEKGLHYSNFESDVVGTRMYSDDRTSNERIRIQIVHSYV